MALSSDIDLPGSTTENGKIRREFVDRLFDDFSNGRIDECVAAFTADLKMEVPWQAPGMTRKCRTPEELRALLTWTYTNFVPFSISASQSWELESDGLAVIYATDAIRERTGRPYKNEYVGLFFFEDGLISRWVEYHNPMITVVALGR
ncbi:nuclear transport factor 2 family protein [Pseudonocardia kujensis]|uniref:nuclear transport factor 2 family protein n=1 Tax=Pseudonocardia kujensis TaxID=1128675 RepID=UPI001E5675C6|nr:nuclear transport factor 2 family protein [Pseudonocardia kujensis]MCE0767621.1 nuclear transport factor 2 family protein [Pseudonocardia kujensis]